MSSYQLSVLQLDCPMMYVHNSSMHVVDTIARWFMIHDTFYILMVAHLVPTRWLHLICISCCLATSNVVLSFATCKSKYVIVTVKRKSSWQVTNTCLMN